MRSLKIDKKHLIGKNFIKNLEEEVTQSFCYQHIETFIFVFSFKTKNRINQKLIFVVWSFYESVSVLGCNHLIDI